MHLLHAFLTHSCRPSRTGAAALFGIAVVASLIVSNGSDGQDKVSDTRIRIEFSQGKRFGLMIKDREDRYQKLTCFSGGQTNRTQLKVDGHEVEFGSPAGRWHVAERDPSQKTAKGPPKGGPGVPRSVDVSTWVYENVHVTQDVSLVTSDKGGERDTCLVRYAIQNLDDRKHTVELRVVIDTLIADNDGSPFLVEGKLITTQATYVDAKVPGEVFALQHEDKSGLAARLQLKGLGIDPARFIITRWGAISRAWDFQPEDMGKDSAVAIYWGPRTLEKKGAPPLLLGYKYGLGKVP